MVMRHCPEDEANQWSLNIIYLTKLVVIVNTCALRFAALIIAGGAVRFRGAGDPCLTRFPFEAGLGPEGSIAS